MKVTLTADISWRGQVYLKGDREVPDELALALASAPAGLALGYQPTAEEAPAELVEVEPETKPAPKPPPKTQPRKK